MEAGERTKRRRDSIGGSSSTSRASYPLRSGGVRKGSKHVGKLIMKIYAKKEKKGKEEIIKHMMNYPELEASENFLNLIKLPASIKYPSFYAARGGSKGKKREGAPPKGKKKDGNPRKPPTEKQLAALARGRAKLAEKRAMAKAAKANKN